MARKEHLSPFQALARKFEKIFRPNDEDDDEELLQIRAATSNLKLSAAHQKELEKAIREELRRQREIEAEKRRQELLESTMASTPWKPKPRPGDELYPSLKSSKSSKSSKCSKSSKKAKSTATSSPKSKKPPPKSSNESGPSDSSGLEPPPVIDVDDDPASNSVRASSLKMLLEDLANDEEMKASTMKKSKPLRFMTPMEVVEARHNDNETYRRLIRENTVLAVAESMSTDADRKKSTKNIRRSGSRRVKVDFNRRVEKIFVPVGRPYKPRESRKREKGYLNLERSPYE